MHRERRDLKKTTLDFWRDANAKSKTLFSISSRTLQSIFLFRLTRLPLNMATTTQSLFSNLSLPVQLGCPWICCPLPPFCHINRSMNYAFSARMIKKGPLIKKKAGWHTALWRIKWDPLSPFLSLKEFIVLLKATGRLPWLVGSRAD